MAAQRSANPDMHKTRLYEAMHAARVGGRVGQYWRRYWLIPVTFGAAILVAWGAVRWSESEIFSERRAQYARQVEHAAENLSMETQNSQAMGAIVLLGLQELGLKAALQRDALDEPRVLAMLRPAIIAHILAPLPRCATTTFPAAALASISARAPAMYS